MQRYESWGRYPDLQPARVKQLTWRNAPLPIDAEDSSVLAFGLGRSYGDSCLNENATLLDVTPLDRFIAFDPHSGLLTVEAGVTLASILEFAVPRGWFLPVTPGTKYITVGGAIANDVHGKNHHRAGTFSLHVPRFELLRSDGSRLLCSPRDNADLFAATIGGLGLTGLITWAEVQLRPVANPMISMETVRFASLDEFLALSLESDRDYEYTVAWVDCAAGSSAIGRGLFMRGNHAGSVFGSYRWKRKRPFLRVPFNAPSFSINRWSIKLFNSLFFHKQIAPRSSATVPYEPFFYPLDAVLEWKRIYGKKGFFQYQNVIPPGDLAPMREIMSAISSAGQGSFLAVLKMFGSVKSPGLLSFPRHGFTLAIDIPNRGVETLKLLDRLDEITFAAGGALYPAKDARMSPESFARSYPGWERLRDHIDPKFSSSFWRRVTNER